MNRLTFIFVALFLIVLTNLAQAHHFKGLPHFSYFENYPQVPQDEFLAEVGEFEMSLVIYDFQGIDRGDAEQPDDVRLYLVIYNLRQNKTYNGPLKLTILDGDQPVHIRRFDTSEEESLYAMQRTLNSDGRFSLQVEFEDGTSRQANIPFILSSQKTAWGPWIVGVLIVLIGVAAVGSRRARVMMDRKANAQRENPS